MHKFMNYWSKMTMCMWLIHVFMVFFTAFSCIFWCLELLLTTTTPKQKQLVIFLLLLRLFVLYYIKYLLLIRKNHVRCQYIKIIANKSMWMGDAHNKMNIHNNGMAVMMTMTINKRAQFFHCLRQTSSSSIRR